MENQNTPPPMEETPTASTPWYDRFYPIISHAFPNAIYSHIKKGDSLQNIVSWTAEDTRFVLSWYPLEADEIQWQKENLLPRTDETLD